MSTKQFKKKIHIKIYYGKISEYQEKAYKILEEENVKNKGLVIKMTLNFSKATVETTRQ